MTRQDDVPVVRAIHPWVAEAEHSVRFGLFGGPFSDWLEAVEFVQLAEELGFDSYLAYDHPTRLMDCWSILTALAAATKRIRLLSLVSCIYYRSPALVARLAADVDRISNGRLILGLGAGDDQDEFRQLNIPFPPLRDRQEALEDTIAIVTGLWTTERVTFEGRQFQVTDAALRFPPVQQPHVPLLIGGGGEHVTLRQVAQYADVSNFGPHEWSGAAYEVGDVRRKYEALRRHCEALGRPYEAILRSYYTPLLVLADSQPALQSKLGAIRKNPREHFIPIFGTPGEAVTHYQALVDAGVQYFLVAVQGKDTETVRLLAEQVIPELRPRTGSEWSRVMRTGIGVRP